MYLKYKSLENHYNLVPQYLNLDMMVSVGEKIDGSNFAVIIKDGKVAYSSRNQITDGTWNGLAALVEPNLEEMLAFAKDKGTVHFYGEVFSSKILRRIPYGDPKIRFFDIAIDGEMLSGEDFMLATLWLPVITTVTMKLSTALKLDVEELQSQFADAGSEGIVIKAYHDNKINDRVYAIKYKSKKFAELSGTKVKTPKTLTAQQVEFATFVNESRMLSFISKEGEPTKMQDMSKYIKGILQDALDEYLSTLAEEDRMKVHEDRAITKVGAGIIAPMLRARIEVNGVNSEN